MKHGGLPDAPSQLRLSQAPRQTISWGSPSVLPTRGNRSLGSLCGAALGLSEHSSLDTCRT